MTKEEIKDALRTKPDYREVEFAGKSWEFLLCKRAFDIAKRREGIEPGEIVASGEEEEDISKNLSKAAALLWTGFLPFHSDVELETVEQLTSLSDAQMIGELMQDVFEGTAPAGKEKDEAEDGEK